MQRFLTVLAVAAIAAFVYTSAAPGVTRSYPTAQQFAALKKQLAALQRTTKRLKSNQAVFAKAINTEASAIAANYVADACTVALTGDELQDTWNWITPYPIISLDDKGACKALNLNRVPPATAPQTPPLYPYFQDMINRLVG
jgi:hypothetical protein